MYVVSRPKVDFAAQNRRLPEEHVEQTLIIADAMISVGLACHCHAGLRLISPAEILECYVPQKRKRGGKRYGGKPFWWRVPVCYEDYGTEKSIKPDHTFGIGFDDPQKKPNWFFLETGRGTMVVRPHHTSFDTSSIFK